MREFFFIKIESWINGCRGLPWSSWFTLLFAATGVSLHAQTDGTLRWVSKLATIDGQVYSSPAVGADGTVYVGVDVDTTPQDGMLQAVNRDGSIKWTYRTGKWVDSAPAIGSDGTIYFGCWDGNLYALNSNGKLKWKHAVGAIVISSPAIGADGTIYVGSDDYALHAVSKEGVELWKYSARNTIESSPAIAADGTIYFGSTDRSIYAIKPDGSYKWSVPTLSSVASSPAIDLDGTVYVGSYDGFLYALAPEDGAIKWKFETAGQIHASPAIGPDRTIYFGSFDKSFYAVNPNGTKKWSVGVGGAIFSSAAIRSDGTVIFGSDDGLVRALFTDPGREGVQKWFQLTDDIVESSPVVAPDGTVYVGSIDGRLYSINGSGAPASGFSRWPMFRHNSMRAAKVHALADNGRLVNLSARAHVTENTPLIAGVVTKGDEKKNYMIRAIGPSLAQLDVADPLRDPTLVVRPLDSEVSRFSNDDWGAASNAVEIMNTANVVGGFPLPTDSKDAVVLGSLPGGPYTATLGCSAGDSGIALIEAYDGAPTIAGSRLINLSTRAQVGTGGRLLIPGLVIGGSDAVRVLVRAVGPGLAQFGVSGVLVRPTMTVFAGPTGTEVHSNTGWSSSLYRADIAGAASLVGAFPLAKDSADCAALLTLNPGAYTIQVSGEGGTTGEALVEVYLLP